jgi:glycosyltransferase involved in cell wall biosynthesis
MKISLLTDGIYPYVIGGMQTHSYYLAKFLAKKKVKVDLYHPEFELGKEEFMRCFSPEEAEFIRPVMVKVPSRMRFPGHYIYESYQFSKNICSQYLKREKPDLIYAQGFTGWELINRKRKETGNIAPIAVNFHGLNMFQQAFGLSNHLQNFMFRPPVKYILKNADHVFSLGTNLSKLLVDNGIKREKIMEIPIGIDETWIIDEDSIRNHDPVSFLFIGRYDRIKGIDILNKAIKNLLKRNNSFEFNFIGPFPEEVKIMDPKIIYHGEIKDAQYLRSLVRNNDILVLSSYSEGMPTVIIEAMASGLAIIATDVGAVSELVDDTNGFLIQSVESAELEKAMTVLMDLNQAELLKLKKASLSKMKERFIWEAVINQTLEEIKKKIR